jgi:hypothetical protein
MSRKKSPDPLGTGAASACNTVTTLAGRPYAHVGDGQAIPIAKVNGAVAPHFLGRTCPETLTLGRCVAGVGDGFMA